jgi:hypothetical protein
MLKLTDYPFIMNNKSLNIKLKFQRLIFNFQHSDQKLQHTNQEFLNLKEYHLQAHYQFNFNNNSNLNGLQSI